MFQSFQSRREEMALGSLSLALLMTALDASLANTSLPVLAKAFGGSFGHAQWIVLAYLLSVTSLSVAAGRVGDLVGRRRVFLAAIAVFTLTSAVCAVIPSFGWLVAARVVQGAAAAAMMALALGLVGDIPNARPERAMGRLAAMSAVGTTIGPALGSAVWHLGPGAIFLVNVPLGCTAFLLALRSLPHDGPRVRDDARFDAAGTLLLAAGLLAYALSMTGGGGAWKTAHGVLPMVAILGVGAFLFVESRARSPLVPVATFRDPVLAVSLATATLVAAVVTATLIVGPFYLSRALGLGHTWVGIALSAGPAAAAMTASVAGRLVGRAGAARSAVAGLIVMGAGGAALALSSPAAALSGYLIPLAVLTSGYAVFQTANNTAALAGAGHRRGAVAGLLTVSRNIGQITGASAMGAVFLHASGAAELSSASPDAIATGMRGTMTVATLLIGAALALMLIVRARIWSRTRLVSRARMGHRFWPAKVVAAVMRRLSRQDVDGAGRNPSLVDPPNGLVARRQRLLDRHDPQAGVLEHGTVPRLVAQDVLDRARVRIRRDASHDLAVLRRPVFREVLRAERRPLVGVELRRADEVYDAALGSQQLRETAEEDRLLNARDVVEGERGQDEIESPLRKGREVAVRDDPVIAIRIAASRQSHHLLGDVDAGRLEPERLQEPRRAPGSAPEVERSTAQHVLADQPRDIAKSQAVRSRELHAAVGGRPSRVLVGVGELHTASFRALPVYPR
jgi:MFS family permease